MRTMPSLALMASMRLLKLVDRSLACWISAAMSALLVRTRSLYGRSYAAANVAPPAQENPVIIKPTIRRRTVRITACLRRTGACPPAPWNARMRV
jgi:hypothetical protein